MMVRTTKLEVPLFFTDAFHVAFRLYRELRFILCISALIIAIVFCATAQDNGNTPAAVAVKDAAQNGFQLSNTSSTDVTGNVSVEAALIPASIAKTVFGKEVSNNYAVIALTISNRSSEDAFIVHTIFTDYSQWLLSGGSPYVQQNNTLCPQGSQSTTTGGSNGQTKAISPSPTSTNPATTPVCFGNQLQTWQQQTSPNQINSVETRIVRGQLLDRQPWTTRNWVLRALQATGSIATGFLFVTNEQSWIRGIGAFNGSAIPAAQTLWPDATVGQMNRISDFGFQVNKVIAKQSSDVIVAFFPIDRFLTPDLKSIFISSPAAFFSPLAALMDPKTSGKLEPYVARIFKKEDLENLFTNLQDVIPSACERFINSTTIPESQSRIERACHTADVVNRLSLNTVRVVVGGTMNVDVNKVPPQISSVLVDTPAGKDIASMWMSKGILTGVITGSFLGGGTPAIVNVDGSVITVKRIDQGSTDTELHFTLTLASSLPSGTSKLTFQVSKSPSAGATVKSSTYDYSVQTAPQTSSAQGANGSTSQSGPPSQSDSPNKPPNK